MGYTCGRRHTVESLKELAKKYMTRGEFQQEDPSAYRTSRLKGKEIFDDICSHMIKGKFSIPQLICKKIFETLLGEKCHYDTKQVVSPYEIDVWFEKYNLAIEYNGKIWHKKPIQIERDIKKRQMFKERNIILFQIDEKSRQYERDIKKEVIKFLPTLNKITNNNLKADEVNIIDCADIWGDLLAMKDLDVLQQKISECKNIAEFQRKYNSEYGYLTKSKQMHLLEPIRERILLTDEELIEKCKNVNCYKTFTESHKNLYLIAYRRNMLDQVSSHMTRSYQKFRIYNSSELIALASDYNTKTDLNVSNHSLFREINKRDNISWNEIPFKGKS